MMTKDDPLLQILNLAILNRIFYVYLNLSRIDENIIQFEWRVC